MRCEKCWATLAQFAPSIAVRECADCVCAVDARRCWFVLLVEGGRVVARMAERNCGGAADCEEGFRPCGTSSSFQGDEATQPEPFLDGFDCSNLEWKLHEGALGYGPVEQSTDESWISRAHRSLGSSSQ